LEEKRGKIKKKDKIHKLRQEFIIEQYKKIVKKTKRKYPLPISIIQERWSDKLNELFENSPAEAEKYNISDATIRRIIKSYIKK
jgi:nitrogen regulatory protein PII-like uncharacterized protein